MRRSFISNSALFESLVSSPLLAALFDPAWYLDRYPSAVNALSRRESLTALDHYLKEGILNGCVCTPFFDAEWYVQAYPDVRKILSDKTPIHQQALQHYLELGCREDRNPNAIFDELWYSARYGDGKQFGHYVNCYHHFLVEGAAAGFSPSPLFDESWYRHRYGDVAAAIAHGLLPSGYHDYLRRPPRIERTPLLTLTRPGIAGPISATSRFTD
jgi:hypothetical protein